MKNSNSYINNDTNSGVENDFGVQDEFEDLDLDYNANVYDSNPTDHQHRASVQSGARYLFSGLNIWLFPPTANSISRPGTDHYQPRAVELNQTENQRSLNQSYQEQNENQQNLRGPFNLVTFDSSIEEFERTEQTVLTDLSRHYIALALGLFMILTIVQLVSMTLMLVWEYAPVMIGLLIMLISVLVYWRYIWKVHKVPFKRLWHTPYPYAITSAILGSLSQHSIFLVYEGHNWAHLLISFFLVEAFYIILVSAAYQEFMNKWEKIMVHRKLCHNALLRYERKKRSELYSGEHVKRNAKILRGTDLTMI
mmetsp:Transcript_6045/g.7628  ORF Transcript_6045/g.7628 Transcript_6045/m.7628 type:complete len:309 (+) Transcript_6045:106-1032(+)|eukprot:CAMPEP_0204886128 /NCGR_PEP_ID=MMETSP1349-20130617/14522_1 /ASSEMBLY_ACC=CAM_ASM_000710 /TAXON_ID=215587 /ORGANISM="Aplanochytrium stocchinoi, Strain GSBS06" /LENGTH=308 /DNA_ID=CAMNT_0052048033 /DNA_START=97 /DNA_END=1023 /DNA_ORIENTATION=-